MKLKPCEMMKLLGLIILTIVLGIALFADHYPLF